MALCHRKPLTLLFRHQAFHRHLPAWLTNNAPAPPTGGAPLPLRNLALSDASMNPPFHAVPRGGYTRIKHLVYFEAEEISWDSMGFHKISWDFTGF